MKFKRRLLLVPACAALIILSTTYGQAAFGVSATRMSTCRDVRARARHRAARYGSMCSITGTSLKMQASQSGNRPRCRDLIQNRTVNLSSTDVSLPMKRGIPFVLTLSACQNSSVVPVASCNIHPEVDPFENMRWSSCAVVGNARSLLRSGVGLEIDAHEAVFRINMAPTLGFQDDVGSKTAVRFSYPPICGSTSAYSYEETHICMRAAANGGVYGAYLAMRTAFFLVYSQKQSTRTRYNLTDLVRPGFFASSRDFDGLHRSAGLVINPTSGLYAVLFAMSKCDHVSVYGFTVGLSQNGPVPPWHSFKVIITTTRTLQT